MRFLLDTDHATIIQFPTQPASTIMKGHLDSRPRKDVVNSVISFHEQLIGAHATLNSARRVEEVIRGYDRLSRNLKYYSGVTVLPFDEFAAAEFDRLRSRGVRRVATMDLRIASIALSRGLTLLTRNAVDFSRVPGLVFEDWTT